MKKVLCCVLGLILMLQISIPVLAETVPSDAETIVEGEWETGEIVEETSEEINCSNEDLTTDSEETSEEINCSNEDLTADSEETGSEPSETNNGEDVITCDPTDEAPIDEITQEETDLSETEEDENFEEGYVFVRAGVKGYEKYSSDKVLGTFQDKSLVYGELVNADRGDDDDWIKVTFDTYENKMNNQGFISVYVQVKDVIMTDENDVNPFLDESDRRYKDVYLPLINWEYIADHAAQENADEFAETEVNADEPIEAPVDQKLEEVIPSPVDQKLEDAIPSPINLVIYQSSQNSIKISWDPVDGADYYELYRSADDENNWIKAKNVYTNDTSNLNLKVGKSYFYKVRAVTSVNGMKQYGLFSESVNVYMKQTVISDLAVSRVSQNSVKLSWTAIDGALKYNVYRRIDNGSWTYIKKSDAAGTMNLNLKPGKMYSYKIRAYISTEGGAYYAPYSNEVTIQIDDTKPQNFKVTKASASSVRMTWDKVEGADHYELFRSVDSDQMWRKVKNITGEIGSNLSLKQGCVYYYKIRAVFLSNEGDFAGDFSDAVSFELPPHLNPPTVSIQQVGLNRADLSWETVDKAEYYYLYRRADGGKWIRLKNTSQNSVSNLSLKEGVTYQYKVTAVSNASGKECESAYSNIVTFSLGDTFTSISDLTSTYSSDTCVTLSFTEESADVEGHYLYRQVDNGEWKRIKRFAGTQTNNTNLIDGEIYSYYVRAYRTGNNGIYYSLPSNISRYWNQRVSGLSILDGRAAWTKVENATSYNVLGDGVLLASTSENMIALSDEFAGKSITVVALTEIDGEIVESYPSDPVVYEIPCNVKYRALLIGETAYTTRLDGPDNDLAFMRNMLNTLSNKYDVTAQENATLDEIVSLMDIAFEGATNDDVSLFYFSGHGVTGSGDYYAGALVTVDYQYLTTTDLAELLSNVPGRVIVILDSCGSGAAITDVSQHTLETAGAENTQEDFAFDPAQFNSQVIDAFSSFDSVIPSSGASTPGSLQKTGELRQTKFHVITGSAYEENSLSLQINGVWGGALTRGVAHGTGCSFPGGVYSGAMPADTNSDNSIGFGELADSCKEFASGWQHVMSYSASPDYVIFIR